MFGVGSMELLIIATIGVLLFGQRLPNVMRDIGRSLSEFKRGMNDSSDDRADAPPLRRSSA